MIMYRVSKYNTKGVPIFIEKLGKTKKEYLISDIIEITTGQFGNDIFRKYMEDKNENNTN